TEEEAGGHRAFVRRPDRADRRGSRPGDSDRGGRSRAVPRRPAPAVLGPEVRLAGPAEPGEPQPRDRPDLRAVPLWVGQRRWRGRGQGAVPHVPRTWTRRADLP